MKKYTPWILILLAFLCGGGIYLLKVITDNGKLTQYNQIRHDCKEEVADIYNMESNDYIKKIDVKLDYRTEDVYKDSDSKVLDDATFFSVRLEESFSGLDVKERLVELIKIDRRLHECMLNYRKQAGYESFIKKHCINDSYFEVNGVRYYVIDKLTINYYCESDEYVMSDKSMTIVDHLTGAEEKYLYTYENDELTGFAKHEAPTKNNTATQTTKSNNNTTTQSGKSSSRKTTEKSHDPDDYDVDSYYEDYKDEFEDEDDAWDDFEDNEGWEDY